MTATDSVPVALADAEQQAADARAAADAVRARIAAGDATVSPVELGTVEQVERHADATLQAARRRDQERRDRATAEQLERDRAAMQTEFAAASTEPAELRELLATAAGAAADFLAVAADREHYLDDLHRRARHLGFRVADRPDYSEPPTPRLAREILAAARGRVPGHWTIPRQDRPRGTMWGD